jgi:hypothetical protein
MRVPGRAAPTRDEEFEIAIMARKSGGRPPQAIRYRAAKTAAAMASPSAVAQAQPKKKVSLA